MRAADQATDRERKCCPLLHYGHCQHNSCHRQCVKAEEFFRSLAKSQGSQQKHNNILCFIDGQRRTYALQTGGRAKLDDFVETIFAARLGEQVPKGAQSADAKLVWYSNAHAPKLPHAVTICEQQFRFGKTNQVAKVVSFLCIL